MSDRMRPTEEDIQAYIDGELDGARAADVEAAMRADADLARQVHAFRADKARLSQFYGPLLDRPVPQEWLERIANRNVVAMPAPMARRRMIGLAAAASVAAAVGGTFVFRRLNAPAGDTLIADALAAHAEAPRSSAPTSGGLEDILGVAVKAPDLSKMGFALAGQRTQGGPGARAAAVLTYRDAGARVFTVFLRASPGEPAFEMLRRGNVRICLWQDDVLSTVMLADISAAEMLRLASLAYTGLRA